ncbi:MULTISPECIES: glycoside hydrolase family 71 protein [unclassified Bradyrhizobium]|uniref:glycoside hydrolase family 71 protein n=1 Tax=unclassified Bradyrhizobium TaxID=2631580 RepID=UPI0030C6A97A
MLLLLQLSWILAAVPSYAMERAPKLVFAHYMACCPFAGHEASIDALRHEMDVATRAGIDGFAVNVGAWLKEPYYQDISSRLFRAAQQSTFKLFFSADASTGLSASEVVDMVTRFSSDPAYLRHAGRPVLSTYGGTLAWYQDILRGLRDQGLAVFFVPNSHRPAGGTNIPGILVETPDRATLDAILADLTFSDGLFYFGAAGKYPSLAQSSRLGAELSQARSKLYMAPVTPYYRGLKQNFRVFEADGFLGMAEQWKAAIESGSDWVEIVTWNDWGEASYVRPFEGQLTVPLWNNHWGLLTAHDAYLSLSGYYIKWFKDGEPPRITQDKIHVFYRPQSSSKCGYVLSLCPRGSSELRDDLHIVAEASRPFEIEVMMGAERRSFSAGSGLHFYRVKLQSGPISITINSANAKVRWDAPIEYASRDSEVTVFNYLATSIRFDSDPPLRTP